MFNSLRFNWNLATYAKLTPEGIRLYVHDNLMEIYWEINPPIEEMIPRLPHVMDYM